MALTTQHKTVGLYAAFGLCVLMICLPYAAPQLFSIIFTVVVLVAASILRKKSSTDSLEAHHATFVIRTIYVWSGLLILGGMVAGWNITIGADMSAFLNINPATAEGGIITEDQIMQAYNEYYQTNYDLILKTAITCLAPAQLYAAWRIARGLSRAAKGYRLPNVRSLL